MKYITASIHNSALLFLGLGIMAFTGCSPKAHGDKPMTWHGQVRDARFGSAPAIELTGTPGALSGSVFLIGEQRMNPFDPKFRLPTSVTSQTDKNIQLHVAYKNGEQGDLIIEFTQPLSDGPSSAKVHPLNEPPYNEFVFKAVK